METNSGASQSYDPAAALSDVAASRAAMADRLVTPWWYHVILGANLGFLVAVVATAPTGLWFFAACAVSLLLSLLLITQYKRVTGSWISLSECGPGSRRLWLAFCVVIAVAMTAASVVRHQGGSDVWAAALAVICAVTTVIMGRRIDARIRDEIRAGMMPVPSARA